MNKDSLREGLSLVPMVGVVKRNICFRECAKLIKIAEETGCTIRLVSGARKGSTESLLSLVRMELTPGRTVVVSVSGHAPEMAFRGCLSVLDGEAA